MIRSLKKLGAVCCIHLLATLPIHAHQAWVLPNFFEAAQSPVWLSFDVSWSDHLFHAGHTGSSLNELQVIGSDGESLTLAGKFEGKTKIVGEVELTREGTYRIEASAPPTYWTRVATDQGEKWLRKSKDQVQGAKVVRADLYWSKAVTFVTVGKRSKTPSSAGKDPLELELLDNPADWNRGQKFRLRVLAQGKAVAEQAVKVFAEGADSHEPMLVSTSDQQGVCVLKLDKPGKYLFVAQQETAAKDDPKTDLYSYNFYLLVNMIPVK